MYRLAAPWPELARFAAEVEVRLADPAVRGHIPYALLLVKAAADWVATHPGSKLPQTFAEKTEFKDRLRALQSTIDGVPIEVRDQ